MDLRDLLPESVTLFKIKCSITSPICIEGFKKIKTLKAEQIDYILVDCQDLKFVPSKEFRLIIDYLIEARGNGIECIIFNLNASLYRLFNILNLLRFITIANSFEEALQLVNEKIEMGNKLVSLKLNPIFFCTDEDKIKTANEDFHHLLGYQSREMENMDLRNIVHNRDFQNFQETRQSLRKLQSRIYDMENRFVRKDSSVIKVRVMLKTTFHPDEKEFWDAGIISHVTSF